MCDPYKLKGNIKISRRNSTRVETKPLSYLGVQLLHLSEKEMCFRYVPLESLTGPYPFHVQFFYVQICTYLH